MNKVTYAIVIGANSWQRADRFEPMSKAWQIFLAQHYHTMNVGSKITIMEIEQSELADPPYVDEIGYLMAGKSAEVLERHETEWTKELDDAYAKVYGHIEDLIYG